MAVDWLGCRWIRWMATTASKDPGKVGGEKIAGDEEIGAPDSTVSSVPSGAREH